MSTVSRQASRGGRSERGGNLRRPRYPPWAERHRQYIGAWRARGRFCSRRRARRKSKDPYGGVEALLSAAAAVGAWGKQVRCR